MYKEMHKVAKELQLDKIARDHYFKGKLSQIEIALRLHNKAHSLGLAEVEKLGRLKSKAARERAAEIVLQCADLDKRITRLERARRRAIAVRN